MTYWIADIGANHDGSLDRAKELIKLAKEAGASCAKFQHFQAKDIVSKTGFESLKIAHQAKWDKPVYEMYEDYSIDREWNLELYEAAVLAGIDFMTTPYDFAAVDDIFPLVNAYKIGSGDITYLPLIEYIASKGKYIYLATGASTMQEVERAVDEVLKYDPGLCLMQCNTNYTGDPENFKYVNLNVLRSYRIHWPYLTLGFSDHTPGHSAVLGAIALGAKAIEKHFTDDKTRKGPDHAFALEPREWASMIISARQLEDAMGDGVKRIEENEKESVIVQRRAWRWKDDMKPGVIWEEDLEALRPCPVGALTPADDITGRVLLHKQPKGREIYPEDIS